MKKVLFIIALLMLLVGAASSPTFAASISLKATWTANTEPDMKEYRLYRTDGTRSLLGTVAHPGTLLNFNITVPDNSQGMAVFVLTAVDTNGNESLDSLSAPYSWNTDATPPAAPKDLDVKKQ
jgi:hypothetical protein